MQFFETTQGTMVLGGLIAILGVVLGFIVAVLPGLVRRKRLSKRFGVPARRDLAMRTVLALDDFVGGAYVAVHDAPEFNPDDSGQFVFHADDPMLVLPKNVDWPILGEALAEEILWLPNRIQNVSDGLEALDASPPGFDDYFQHRQEDLSRLGLQALELINKLCDAHGVKHPVRPAYYNPANGFRTKIREMEAFWQRRVKTDATLPKDGSNVTALFGAGRPVPRDQVPDPKTE